jgi:Undecaprenyl-phosphate galactose phosphotransferase WbaP
MTIQTSFKISPLTESRAEADADLDYGVSRVVSLARDSRHVAPLSYEAFPNFIRILQVSGRYLLINDVIGLLTAFVCGGVGEWLINTRLLGTAFQPLYNWYTLQHMIIFSGVGLMSLLWFDTKGHYRQRLPYWETIGQILSVAFVGFIVGGFIQFASKDSSSRLWMGISWGMFAIFLFVGRSFIRRQLDRQGQWQIPALVVGKGATAQGALKALSREKQMGFHVVEQISASSIHDLTSPNAWKALLRNHGACHVFLALEGTELEAQQKALKSMTRARVPCSIIPPWLGLPTSTLSPHHFVMHDTMLLHDTNRLELPMLRVMKRSFDFVAAAAAIILLAPAFLLIAVGIRLDGGPAFFMQARVGRHGKLFNCYKFRSMRIDAEECLDKYLAANPEAAAEWKQYQKLQNDVRVTRFGQWLRRTSLDELPQLINVLKGEMSLVGPRPCMPGQEYYYAEDFTFYESVRPGITGPWQVSGRNTLTFRERVELESWYARNWSFWMDVVIILKTVPTLLAKGQAF